MARSINEVRLLGNIGADPEVRYTGSGKAVTELSVATTHRYKDNAGNPVEDTEWHKVVLWGRQAETAGEYAKKGRQVHVAGRLKTEKWTDRDGIDRYTTKIIAHDYILTGGAPDGVRAGRPAVAAGAAGGAVEVGEDEIPF